MKPKQKMVVISFHCDLALKKALEARAREIGWKRNMMIREAIKQFLGLGRGIDAGRRK